MVREIILRVGQGWRRALSLIATHCALTSAAHAHESTAAPPPVLIHISTSDPCFDQARFVRDLAARLPDKRVELTAGSARADVQVLRLEHGYQAQLRLLSSGTTTLQRTISAATCAEAAEGIAFVTSVALDEDLESTPHPSKASPAPERKGWEMRGAAGAQVAFAALPRTQLGPHLSVYGGDRRAAWWSPGVELGFVVLPPVEVSESAGVARFSLWQLTLDLCPTQARLRAFWLRPCAYGTAGRLRSEGKDTENGQLRRRPYLSAGAELVLGVDLGRWMDVIVRGSWAASLIVDSYRFNDEIFYEQNAFSYGLGAQLSVTPF